MRMYLIIATLLFILYSCSGANEKLSDEVMVDILTDILIADELMAKYGSTDPNNYKDSIRMIILDRYNLDAPEFDSLMILTQKDLKHYHALQSKVSERIDSLKNISNQ